MSSSLMAQFDIPAGNKTFVVGKELVAKTGIVLNELASVVAKNVVTSTIVVVLTLTWFG